MRTFFDMQGGHAIMAGLLKYGTFVPFFPLIATLRAALGEFPYFCNAATACAMAAWEAHAAPPEKFLHSQACSTLLYNI